MKIAITGHTRGIGQSLASHFSAYHNEVIGFSRSNGYNIVKFVDRQRIIEASQDADVFINNVNHGFCQSDLLWELYTDWTARKHRAMIISIGSRAGSRAAIGLSQPGMLYW